MARDGNEAQIVDVFKRFGWSVLPLESGRAGARRRSDLRVGTPDLLIGGVLRGQRAMFLVEIKNPATRYGRRGRAATQQAFADWWRGTPAVVISTVEEALELIGQGGQR